jgi:manganese/zinc/iron transport system substrate-binding protein
MIDVAPDHAEIFRANARTHLAEISDLAVYSQTALASIPAEARVLITAHDAFNYFGAAYGFEVVGIQGISTESEAGLSRISELVQMLVARDIRAVFVESSVSDRNIRALIEGAAARGHQVAIGGELFSDAMGAPGTYEGTYLGMIDHNVTTIVRALGGDAPERGRIDALAMK